MDDRLSVLFADAPRHTSLFKDENGQYWCGMGRMLAGGILGCWAVEHTANTPEDALIGAQNKYDALGGEP